MLGFPGRIWLCHFSVNNCGAVWSSLIGALYQNEPEIWHCRLWQGACQHRCIQLQAHLPACSYHPKADLHLMLLRTFPRILSTPKPPPALSSCFALCVLDGLSSFPQLSVCYCVESAAGETRAARSNLTAVSNSLSEWSNKFKLLIRINSVHLSTNRARRAVTEHISRHTERRWRGSVPKIMSKLCSVFITCNK